MPALRSATLADAPALLAIYAPYVEGTAISFEYESPTLEDFRARMEGVLAVYPWLVAEEEGEILGYAYAHPFIPRKAYEHCAEVTIYLRRDCRGKGVGRLLYTELERLLSAQDVRDLYACVGVPRVENDPYLTMTSPNFHAAMGYVQAGYFPNSGYKFDRWYDMVWLRKSIGGHDTPPAFRVYPDVAAGED